jgi:hypothetical protein
MMENTFSIVFPVPFIAEFDMHSTTSYEQSSGSPLSSDDDRCCFSRQATFNEYGKRFSRQSTVEPGASPLRSFSRQSTDSSAWADIRDSDDEYDALNTDVDSVDSPFAIHEQDDDDYEVCRTWSLLVKNSFIEFAAPGGPQELALKHSRLPRVQSAPCLRSA